MYERSTTWQLVCESMQISRIWQVDYKVFFTCGRHDDGRLSKLTTTRYCACNYGVTGLKLRDAQE